MVRKAFSKTILRSFKSNISKVFSMIVIMFLGIAFVSGLGTVTPSFRRTMSDGLKAKNIPDIILKSTSSQGFEEEGDDPLIFDKLKSLDYVSNFEAVKTLDSSALIQSGYISSDFPNTRFYGIDQNSKLARLEVVEGRLPEDKNEICVEQASREMIYYEIGDTIDLGPVLGGEKTIVGIVSNPLIFSTYGELDNIGHITDVIKRFDQNKKQLKNKDIMQFKSVEEVDNYLNNDYNYNELTDRQRLRQTQKNVRNTDVDKDATKVFENSMWEVWVPNTYEASCKLGQGTQWCTATTSTRDYFDSYTNDGKLYININKSTGDKYQFHFESESFMDEDDEEIDVEDFFLTNGDLAKFYSNIDSTGIAKRMLMLVERRNQIKDGEVIYTQYDYDNGLRFAPISADVTGVVVKCKKVGKYAFERCNNISVVVLEEGVEEIEEDAFAYCGYMSMLYIPATLKTIGDCFVGTTIGNLHITSIEAWNKVKFLSVNSIPNGGNLYIGDSLIKNLTINDDIKEYCFSDFDSIETVKVKEGVTKIGNGAFTGCKNLITVKLPNTLKEIKNFAFFGCEKLSNINIPESVVFTEDNTGTFSRSGVKTLSIPGTAKIIPSKFCAECTNLTGVHIGEGIDYIGRDAFRGCSSLNSVFIPKSVTTVMPNAFSHMKNDFTVYCEVERKDADTAGYQQLLSPNFYYRVVFGAKREQSN